MRQMRCQLNVRMPERTNTSESGDQYATSGFALILNRLACVSLSRPANINPVSVYVKQTTIPNNKKMLFCSPPLAMWRIVFVCNIILAL